MNANTAANYLLYLTDGLVTDITNMKINKLLYYAQGICLKKYGRELFHDSILAAKHGPLIEDVYQSYRKYGSKPISEYDSSVTDSLSETDKDVLMLTARMYGGYTAAQLRNMTHRTDAPWKRYYSSERPFSVIPNDVIKKYFIESITIPEDQVVDEEVGYRDKDGYIVLPSDMR